MEMTTQQVRDLLYKISEVIEENKQYLTDLDAAIGDGDHGLNMARGFGIAREKLAESSPVTAGDVLKTIAMALISNVGGASGPLYGTLFLKASMVVKDKQSINLEDYCALLKEGIAGVRMRGKAQLGEKTMLDVLIPVLDYLENELSSGDNPKDIIKQAAAVAKDCAEQTKDIKATKGRASYLGERSIGHIDPGAMSSYLMIQAISDYIN